MSDREEQGGGWDDPKAGSSAADAGSGTGTGTGAAGGAGSEEREGSRYARTLEGYEREHGEGGGAGEGDGDYRFSNDPAGVRGRGVGSRPIWPWLLVLLLVVLAAWAWVELRSTEDGSGELPIATADVAPEPASRPVPEPEEVVEEEIELPALNDSDSLVAELVEQLSAHPDVARYLVGEELVRRFTATVDNIAQGTSPRPHLPALAPQERFTARAEGGVQRPTAESYRRYDVLAEIFVSLDSEGSAELYRQLEPLITESYRELGYPDADFDATLRTAIDHLLAAPVPPPGAELRPRGIGRSFEYADERYESLSPAQKHLLRMGPDNVRRVQRKLRELRASLGL